MGKFFKVLSISILFTIFANAYQITPQNFRATLSKHKLVVVKYWASWCVPCSILKPEYEKAQQELKKGVLFTTYNVDLGGAKSKGVDTIPTIVLYKNGKEVSRKEEILISDAIVQWVQSYMN